MERPAKPKITLVINALIAFGIFGCFLIIAVTITAFVFTYRFASRPSPASALPGTTSTIGELGSRCGGPEGLPCKPGLFCSVEPDEWHGTYGECVTDTRSTQPMGALGSECSAHMGCGPGLRCAFQSENATGTCERIVTSTPPAEKPR